MAKSKKKKSGGIGTYQRKINNSPGVKAKSKKVNKLKAQLKKAQSEKKRAVKKAQIAYRKKHKSK